MANVTLSSRTIAVVSGVALTAAVVAGAAIYNLNANRPKDNQMAYAKGAVLLEEVMASLTPTPANAMALEYNGSAHSEDGKTFFCYIANAQENQYDMYIDVYSDATLENEIYLSGLFSPGTGLQEVTLDEPLESGAHTVYVAFTQVEDDRSTIHNQVVVTMQFEVA